MSSPVQLKPLLAFFCVFRMFDVSFSWVFKTAFYQFSFFRCFGGILGAVAAKT